MLFIATMARIIISILLILFSFQSHSQIAMWHAHNQACDGTGLDANAQQFVDSLNTWVSLTTVQKCAINNLVTELKGAGLWSKLYCIYPYVGGSKETHSYNLKNPTQYRITWGLVGTSDANGGTGSGGTGFTAAQLIDSAGNYSVSLGVYHPRDATLANSGAYAGGSGDGIWVGQNTTDLYNVLYYFSGSADLLVATSTATGMYHLNRSSQTRQDFYLNGTSIANATASTSRTGALAGEFFVNKVNAVSSISDAQMRFYWIGKSLDATEAANIYTIIQKYQTALGRQL